MQPRAAAAAFLDGFLTGLASPILLLAAVIRWMREAANESLL